jgi:succinate dehydrogenase/fumarate reductase flavoprotein subunit
MVRRTIATLNDGTEVPTLTVQTLIIGSGAAALNCAEHLWEMGTRNLAIATDSLGAGTSNNSGSDKQTYYKIGIFGDTADSPIDFARALTAGGMCHGDIAYCEALGSAPEFFHLARNGVPFPFNRYGAYVGYKTDHDPLQRATSAGPKTSMFMFGRSLAQVRRYGIPIFDRHEVIALVTAGAGDNRRVVGAVAIDRARVHSGSFGLVLFNAENVVMATGGPGELYAESVYPEGQIGNHGIALEIGAVANNLSESQYGLASIGFRWNLSGTYQQVIPAYFSTDAEGGDKRYFLNEYHQTMTQEATNIFLKGYQWPFHAARLQDYGSSLVDIAVYNERQAGRRVFMDFTSNPVADQGLEPFRLQDSGKEAVTYLQRSGAMEQTPYERLAHMNQPSIDLYAEHDVDLKEPLEVAVCAQHCNGGLRGNIWWESNIRHLFPIGELNGSHGVRPGGSALNAGQVGGLRAATYIAKVYSGSPLEPKQFLAIAAPQVEKEFANIKRMLSGASGAIDSDSLRRDIQERMSRHAAFVRSVKGVAEALREARQQWADVQSKGIAVKDRRDTATGIQNQHLCLTQLCFLETIQALIERGGGSRGAYVMLDDEGDLWVETKRGRELQHRGENEELRQEILETRVTPEGEVRVSPVSVRPLPEDESWYETTWREWQDGNIYD